MIVTVKVEDLQTVDREGTMFVVTGTDEQGRRVRFAGQHGPMGAALDGVERDGEAACEVEDWMVLSIAQPPPRTPDEKYKRYQRELCPDCPGDVRLQADRDGILGCPRCGWAED